MGISVSEESAVAIFRSERFCCSGDSDSWFIRMSAHMPENIAVVPGSGFTVYKEYFLPVTKTKLLMIFGAHSSYWL